MSVAHEMETPPRLLVVEDESDIGTLLEYLLRREGFRVSLATTGRQALDLLGSERPELVVLDLMLPDMSGLEILRHVRTANGSATRVIILSAKQTEADKLTGFELGADDYMVKPFSPSELMVRIRKALDVAPAADPRSEASLAAGPIEVDLDRHEVRIDGAIVHLTLTEFRLLADMMRHVGRVRTRAVLMSEVWGYDSQVMSRTIDTHIRRLRAKVGSASEWITTVRGVGYRLQDPADSDG